MFYVFNDDSNSEKNRAVMENNEFISCHFYASIHKGIIQIELSVR